MSWSDLWTFYRGCGSDSIRKQILEQINLKDFLPHHSYKIQFEILEHAPLDVMDKFQSLLSDKAKKKLGIEKNILSMREIDKIMRKIL